MTAHEWTVGTECVEELRDGFGPVVKVTKVLPNGKLRINGDNSRMYKLSHDGATAHWSARDGWGNGTTYRIINDDTRARIADANLRNRFMAAAEDARRTCYGWRRADYTPERMAALDAFLDAIAPKDGAS